MGLVDRSAKRSRDIRGCEIQHTGNRPTACPCTADLNQTPMRLDRQLYLYGNRQAPIGAWPQHEIRPMHTAALVLCPPKLDTGKWTAILTLVATQLTLTGNAMIRVAALERRGDRSTHDQVMRSRRFYRAWPNATHTARTQTGTCDAEQRRLPVQRTLS
jgi:hypothetical protein